MIERKRGTLPENGNVLFFFILFFDTIRDSVVFLKHADQVA